MEIMSFVKTLSGKEISKIGIGSFGVGGRGHRDVALTEKLDDKTYIDALAYTLERGINFTEIALGYGHGQSIKLFKQALDKTSINRKDIFFTHSLYKRDFHSLDVMQQDIAAYYEIMETDYADSTLVTESLILKFGGHVIYPILHSLLDKGKTRFVSLSNASPQFIQSYKQEFGDKVYAHEGHLSFEIRALQDKGVFKTCDNIHIKNIIWRPLGRNKTLGRNWDLLVELNQKYQKTQSQIILNWMCHLGYNPMIFSVRKKHIDENAAASQFTMDERDYQRITDFRPSNYHPPIVHWDSTQTDDDIVTLVKEFEQHSHK